MSIESNSGSQGSADSPRSTWDEPKVNVLLVDDSPANLAVLQAILDGLDLNLVEARSGREALRHVETLDFAVILLDVVMPELSGFETAQLIRSRTRLRHTPIIFVTANDIERSQSDEGYALGAVDFLVKPLSAVAVRAKVAGFVDLFRQKQRARREADLLRLIIDGARDYAIFLLDATGHVQTWNPGAERIKQYRADEIIGQHFSKFYPQEAIDRGWPQHELTVAEKVGRFEDEGWRLRKDGTQFWANVVITTLRDEAGRLRGFSKITRDMTERKRAEEAARRLAVEAEARQLAEESQKQLHEQKTIAETLHRIGSQLAKERDLHRLVQMVTDEGRGLTGAGFGAFFYNVIGEGGEAYTLYTLSGVPREAFEQFPMPRNTDLFGATFRGEGVVRLDDVTKDPRYGRNAPYHGMPQGHLPVRSYLAVPVVSQSGEVLGGLFFGHSSPGVFNASHERILVGIAGQSAVAIDNARLYQRTHATAERLNLALAASDLGDWSWEVATDRVTLSERAAEIFGIPPGPYMTWTEMQNLVHPEDRERARLEVQRVIEARTQYDIEYRLQRPDGKLLWIGVLGRAIYNDEGRAVGMFGVLQDVSERKALEGSLRASEGRFRGLMEQAPISIQIFSPDGRTVRVNRAWEELWGLRPEQIADYNILEDRQLEKKGVLSHVRRAFQGEPTYIPAVQYDPNETIPNGTDRIDPSRWVAAVAYPLKDEAGVLREVVLVHEDITSRRRAEAALRDSEERLRLALEAGRMGVWDWNVRTNELKWSESLEPLHGLQPGTFGGTFDSFQQLIHPDDRERVGRAIQSAVEQGSGFEIEFRNIWPDGSTHWIAGKGKAFIAADGRASRMIGIGMDVTQRRRSEKTSQFLADASAALAVLVDFDSTLQKIASLAVPSFADWATVDLLTDEGTLRRVAVSHSDPAKVALAHEIHRRFPPDPNAPYGLWNVIRTGQSELVTEITDELLDQTVTDLEFRGILRELGLRSCITVPLKVRGKTTGVITFISAESGHLYDATELAVAQELADRGAITIENVQLYRELQTADRRKDEFLATLAHELRNPLAPLHNSLQILKMPHVDPEAVQQMTDMMERQVQHLVRLVDDLLDMSRVMRGKIELRRERIELASVVARAVETAKPLIEIQRHELEISLPSESLLLEADPVRLAQVIGNLLTNAAKYTDPNGRIWLSAQREGNDVVLRVRDSGIGIAPDVLPHVFELFVQADHASTKAQGGLGIGLTLVKNLVEMHHGTVEAHSPGLGAGSEFVVRLPVLTREEANGTGQPVREERAQRTSSGHRLLVVDDNRDAAVSLAMLLRLQGHQVQVAHDGRRALEVAESFSPDVVFLDIGMPGMDGYEVARRMRAMSGLKNVVLAALTGWGQQEDRRRTAEAGFDHHLVKPPEPKAVETLLKSIPLRGAAPAQ